MFFEFGIFVEMNNKLDVGKMVDSRKEMFWGTRGDRFVVHEEPERVDKHE